MSTNIEWCDDTWNPVTGCTPISEGCKNCYAERMAKRLAGRFGYPKDDPFRPGTVHADKLDWPLSLPKGKGKRIFVSSMGDLFHSDVDSMFTIRILDRIAQRPDHTFILLTKRPENALELCVKFGLVPFSWCANESGTPSGVSWPSNAWIGVTAENQESADKRIPILLQIPAKVRFVSVEPMLGPVDLSRFLPDSPDEIPFKLDSEVLQWVICGGETGPGSRTMMSAWAMDLQGQCLGASTPFFFKKHSSFWVKSMPNKLAGQKWEQFPKGA